ncbi:ABC transporter permease [Pandoraea pulmonicola]|uniref:ABC transporter permease n=1 Tax=Pandoraea pulmonicola TaxID=93221 RepID=A0AAJ4ZA90_PANPU|nr:ABC transporter permease [Pandoraea pulmonicola]AJC21580.1 ABC transporter permease [Pandoraea pulmonicola]SUA89607.1 Glutathione transport system permease protein gsiC [Pandoraea pulmonicola]
MHRYLLSRIARALLTALLAVTFTFFILRLTGDPAVEILGNEASPEALAAFRAAWGLDHSLLVQFGYYIKAVLSGDLGQSMRDGRAALEVVLERIPVSLAITVPALLINILIGIPAGIFAALHRGSVIDRVVMLGAIAGFTVPAYVLGLLLVLAFSVGLQWLPSGGAQSWTSAILPVITLGVHGSATLARFVRSAMLEVLAQPYIRTATAKGVPWWKVVRHHAFPNAAIPTVTIVGFMVGHLIAGAVIVESVFSWPGIGQLLVVSVASRDLAVVQCLLFLVTIVMVISNILVDVAYGLLDPRMANEGNL